MDYVIKFNIVQAKSHIHSYSQVADNKDNTSN